MASVFLVGCKKDSSVDASGPSTDVFEISAVNLIAPAKVGIKTTFDKAGQYKWNFKGAYEQYDPERKDYSLKLQPDTLLYEQPGTYEIALTYYLGNDVKSKKTVIKEIKVGKPIPAIEVKAIKLSPGNEVILTAVNYWNNPEQKPTFDWEIDGKSAGNEKSISTIFSSAGSKNVKLTVFDGSDRFVVESQIDVKLPTSETQSKTLYYADVITGFIYGKLVPADESKFSEVDLTPRKVFPIPTNTYILGMKVHENDLVIFDSGVKIAASGPADNDAEIYKLDVTKLNPVKNVIISKGSFNGTNDCVKPFGSAIDGSYIYTTSRLYHLFKAPISSASADFQKVATSVALTNSNGGAIISIQGGLQVEGDNVYTSRYSHSLALTGIWKHNLNTGKAEKLTPNFVSGTPISSFVIDGDVLYYATNPTSATGVAGTSEIVRCNIDGSNKKVVASYTTLSIAPSSPEIVGIRSLALDKESGLLYWSIRNGGGTTLGISTGSGIVSWKTDGSSDPKMIVPGVVSVSVALDQTLR